MLFWKVAVPCPSITKPQIRFAVRVEVTLRESTRFCSIRLPPMEGSVKSMPYTNPALPPVTVLLNESTVFCETTVPCVAAGALTSMPVIVIPGLLALPFRSLTALPVAFNALPEL
jgi:hypothetical protein